MKNVFFVLTSFLAISCSTNAKNETQNNRNPSQATVRCITPNGGWCWAPIGQTVVATSCYCSDTEGTVEGTSIEHQANLRRQQKRNKVNLSSSDQKNHLIYVTNESGLAANQAEESQTLDKLRSTCNDIYGGQIDESSIWTGTKKAMSTSFAAGVCSLK